MAVVAVSNTSTYIQGGIEYDVSTSSSGITVNVRFYMRRTNAYSGSTYSSNVTQQICISSDPNMYHYSESDGITVAGGQQNVWQGPYFTASRTFDASRGGQTIYVGWKTTDNVDVYLSGSGNVQITLPTAVTAPTGLAVSNAQKYQNSFAATVSVTGWGGAGDANSRYRELQVWTYNASSLVEPRKYQKATGNTMSSVITVDNNSGYGTLTIQPNTMYTIGMFATNGTYNTSSQRVGDWTTLPPTPSLSNTSVTTTSASFSYSVPNQGGKYNMAVKYQIDGGSKVSVTTLSGSGTKSGSFTVSGLAAGTSHSIVVSLTTTVGEVVSNTVNFTTLVPYKLYGSVAGKTKRITKLYCSVNGKTKRVTKLYGSVGGKTKRIL